MTVPPESSGASVEARRPWIWKMGIVSIARSLCVSLQVAQTLAGIMVRSRSNVSRRGICSLTREDSDA